MARSERIRHWMLEFSRSFARRACMWMKLWLCTCVLALAESSQYLCMRVCVGSRVRLELFLCTFMSGFVANCVEKCSFVILNACMLRHNKLLGCFKLAQVLNKLLSKHFKGAVQPKIYIFQEIRYFECFLSRVSGVKCCLVANVL